MRIGQGWDIHRLEAGKELILGGVKIESETGTVAHSDGDALAHAIIDALLGSVSAGDIGTHFPDNDSKYKNADSMKLLEAAIKIIAEKGCKPVNIDSTVIIQKPRLAPYIKKIRENIAAAAKLDIDAVSVKAKTNEKLGELGAGKAVEAIAAVLVEKKND